MMNFAIGGGASGSGTVTHTTGALTANQVVIGNGTDDLKTLGTLGTTTTLLHGNAAGAPTFGAVVLTTDVSGILPTANGGTGTATPITFAQTPTVGGIPYGASATTLNILDDVATGKVLISGGVATAPSWGLPAGLFLGQTVTATASANFTTGANTRTIIVEQVAGGGGGGGVSSSAAAGGGGGGGGGGGYVRKQFTVTPSTAYAYTNGAGGTAGANTGGTGGTGGDSTFVVGGTTITAKGGTGGVGMTANTTIASAQGGTGGGVSTSGDINGSGAPANFGLRTSGLIATGGNGGSSFFGGGGLGSNAPGAGADGVGHGGGGAGAVVTNASSAVAGGVGSAGQTVVYEYS